MNNMLHFCENSNESLNTFNFYSYLSANIIFFTIHEFIVSDWRKEKSSIAPDMDISFLSSDFSDRRP